ncbi:MAG: DUF4920 domain-containing protein [Xanthomonadales bacterium]|nr:DUF4920 domain-containing protein [Xanthomonadales bacterium]
MKSITLMTLVALALSSAVAAADWFGQAPGEEIEALEIETVLADPDQWLDQPVALSGRMTDVCTNKGCWAVFESGGAMLRIVARDHGFAIPEDARGPAVAHGVLERRELSREAAEHMVTEDGADAALLDDPVEYRLIADGVSVRP